MNQTIKKSPKTSYYIRIAAGGYLLYTAYSLNTDWATVKPEHRLGIGAAIVVFAIVGFILCLVSTLSLIKFNRTQSEKEDDTGTTDGQRDSPELVNTEEADRDKVEASDGKDSETDF